MLYEAKRRRLYDTVMNLLCHGYADWIDGLTVYSVVALASADWTDLLPVWTVLKQCGQLFRQTHTSGKTPLPEKHTHKMHQSKKSKRRVKERATEGGSELSPGVILIEGVHTLKQKGGWMELARETTER